MYEYIRKKNRKNNPKPCEIGKASLHPGLSSLGNYHHHNNKKDKIIAKKIRKQKVVAHIMMRKNHNRDSPP